MPLRQFLLIGSALVLGCMDPLTPASQVSDSPQLLVANAGHTYVVNARLYVVGSSRETPIGHAQIKLVRSADDPSSHVATFSVILFANTPTEATSVGFFQEETPIWNQGDYAGYGPDSNYLQFSDSLLLPELLAMQVIERPQTFSVQGFDSAGIRVVEGTFSAGLMEDPRS